jgi:hypothetical protein
MSWKEFGYLAVCLVVVRAVGHAAGARWGWLAVAVLFVGGMVVGRALAWRWHRQLDRLRRSDPEELARSLEEMDPTDRSAARLALGLVASGDVRVESVDGETFTYPRTPAALREGTFWGSVLMSALPLTLLAVGMVRPDQTIWAAVVGVGFACSVFVQLRSWDAERTLVTVTPAGIQEVRCDGTRRGILWSEVGAVHDRPWLTAVEISTGDGSRRIRVGYTLERFPRFVELLVAYCPRADVGTP